ncbi:hypothetical protein GCM10010275_62790 [Streptomyces litmocidini]|nr:hypothetical protein GCM10010275_62790 [Streptomyces litmocidini]
MSYRWARTSTTSTRTPRPGRGGAEPDPNAEDELATPTEGTKKASYPYGAEGALLVRRAEAGDGESVVRLGATEPHHGVTGTTEPFFLAGDHRGAGGPALDATAQAVTKRCTTPFGGPRAGAAGTRPDDRRSSANRRTGGPGTGLTPVGAREYGPGIARFLGAGPKPESVKHRSVNGYGCAGNNEEPWTSDAPRPDTRGRTTSSGPAARSTPRRTARGEPLHGCHGARPSGKGERRLVAPEEPRCHAVGEIEGITFDERPASLARRTAG